VTKGSKNLAKLATVIFPLYKTSSPSIAAALMPAEGEDPVESTIVLMPVRYTANYSGRVLAPTVAAPRSCIV
jgi:hypothetical protein